MLDLDAYYARFDARVLEAAARAYDRAPGYRARADAARALVRDVASLAQLPILHKDDLIALQRESPPFGGLLTVPTSELRRIYQSPGPIYDPEVNSPDPWRWAAALRAAGFQPGDIVLNAFGYHLTPAGAMFEEGLRALGCVAVPGGIGNQEQQIVLIEQVQAVGYIGLPSYLKALLDKAGNQATSLRRAFVTAEPLPPSLRKLLQDHGLSMRQGYGTAECGLLGYECECEEGLHLPDDVVVQVCDTVSGEPLPPGQIGEIVVTLFAEYALIRFGTGDLSKIIMERCACGRESPRLVGILGRVGEGVKVRGMFLHPRQVENVLARFTEVSAWQAIVTRAEHRDELTFRVAAQSPSAELQARLQEAIRDGCKFNVQVVCVGPNEIPVGAKRIVDERIWE